MQWYKDRNFWVGGTIALTLTFMVGVTIGSSTHPGTPTPTPTQSTPQQGTPPPPPVTVDLKGKGQTATEVFKLYEGVVWFKFTHHGTSNFIVYLMDSEGRKLDGLANEIGDAELSDAIHIDKAGDYFLKVECDGEWTTEVRQ